MASSSEVKVTHNWNGYCLHCGKTYTRPKPWCRECAYEARLRAWMKQQHVREENKKWVEDVMADLRSRRPSLLSGTQTTDSPSK